MTEVISVRFRNGCKEYYFDPKGLEIQAGQNVIVETAQGPEFAQCARGNHQVEDDQVVKPLRGVVRIATDNDCHTAAYNRGREKEAFDICRRKIQQHKLEMKLVRVECSFDGSKILFFFTADGRVDFRDLVKDLAGVFRARIELRQIGVRDEAKMIGGLGICGRPFCCAQFMDEFLPVSIKMAKTQSLSLNPTKISGTCGRLMCCLKYEQEAYEDAVKRMPKQDSFVLTPDGPGNVTQVNLLRETVKVNLDGENTPGGRCYHNCEICVLRNGKGSRDGIEIPAERPERYVEESQEEAMPALIPLMRGVEDPEPPVREKISAPGERGRRRQRRRSGRGGDKSAELRPEKSESRPEKADKPEKAEKSDKRPDSRSGEQRRGERKGGEKPRPEQRQERKKDAPEQAQQAPQPPKTAEGGEQRRRPRHRGGRRRNHRGEGGAAPQGEKSES